MRSGANANTSRRGVAGGLPFDRDFFTTVILTAVYRAQAVKDRQDNPPLPNVQGGFVLHGFLNPPNEITAGLDILPAL